MIAQVKVSQKLALTFAAHLSNCSRQRPSPGCQSFLTKLKQVEQWTVEFFNCSLCS